MLHRKDIRPRLCAAFAALAAAVGAGTNGVELADAGLHLRYVPEARTAYISRGRVCEDRPVMTQLVRVDGALGPFGRAGLWHWDVSALGNRRENLFRRSFHEVDWGFFYRYDWEINKDWTLASEGMKDWLTFPGARGRLRGHSDATIHEYRLYEALKNPYLTGPAHAHADRLHGARRRAAFQPPVRAERPRPQLPQRAAGARGAAGARVEGDRLVQRHDLPLAVRPGFRGRARERHGERLARPAPPRPHDLQPRRRREVLTWDASRIRIVTVTISQVLQEKRVFSPNAYMAEEEDVEPVTCAFARADIPKRRDVRFVVRPIDCWGNKGAAIASPWRRFST